VGWGRRREHRCDTGDPPNKVRRSGAHRSDGVMARRLEAAARRCITAASSSSGWRWRRKAPAAPKGCGRGEGQNHLAGKLLEGGTHRLGGGHGGGGSDSDGFGGAPAAGRGQEAREVGGALGMLLVKKKATRGENIGSVVTGAF
jgi:hypothetical protein